MVYALAVAVVTARADSKQFYLGHKEFTLTVVSVEGGRQVQAGNALVAHYSQDSAADEALMFTEDPQTKNIVTVRGRLCVTNGNGTPKGIRPISYEFTEMLQVLPT